MATIPTRKPRTRSINARSVVLALAGKEPKYPVYNFSGKQKFADPKHNPFKDL